MKVKRSDIVDYLSADQIQMKMRMSAGFIKFQKWLVIYNLLVDPRPLTEIARHTGLSESSVYRIVAEYNDGGPESIETIENARRRVWYECGEECSM